jgi:hypothetical protein
MNVRFYIPFARNCSSPSQVQPFSQCPKLPFPLDCLLLTSRRYAAGTLVGKLLSQEFAGESDATLCPFMDFFFLRVRLGRKGSF